MEALARVASRIEEIRSKVVAPPPSADRFRSILQARLGTGPVALDGERSVSAPNAVAAFATAATPWTGGTVTLGTMLGATAFPTATARPVTGVATAGDLRAYVGSRGVRERNGRLDSAELVEVSGAYQGTARLLPPAASAWETMRAAAAADGIDLRLVGAYRTYESQARAHQAYLEGRKSARVLPPGTSEHGVGLAIDVTNGATIGPGDPEWAWMDANARDYGWFPIETESWHWEFRGAGLTP